MESRSCYCIFFYCVIIIQETAGKTFSLNEAIAVERQKKLHVETTSTTNYPETTAERISLNKAFLTPNSLLKNKLQETRLFVHNKNISPLKYKKTFEIKTPLKPNKFKYSLKQRQRRKNESIKREINGNDKLNQKYIPLLKSIRMLFNNLLETDASNSNEITSTKHKRNRLRSTSPEERNRVVCKCADKSDNGKTESNSPETTTILPDSRTTSSIVTEDVAAIETATTATDYTPVSNVSSIRQYKNLPTLLPGNTVSSWGDDTRVDEGSGAAYNRSNKRNVTRDYGTSEYVTNFRKNEPITKDNEKVTYSSSRDNASCDGSNSGEFGNRTGNKCTTNTPSTNENIANQEDEDFRYAIKFKRENNLETGGNKTKSTKFLSNLVRGLRRPVFENEAEYNREPKQSKEVHTESVINDAYDNAGNQRITNRSRTIATENQKIRTGNETMMLTNESLLYPHFMRKINQTHRAPVVMIIDGYSVTRNKHGENKLTKKAVHFNP